MASNTSLLRSVENALASLVPGIRGVPFNLRYAVYRRVFYSAAYDFAYFRLPKCANSTVVMTLYTAMAQKSGQALSLASGYEGSKLAKRQAKKELWGYALGGYAGRRPFSFTFVRDPAARVLSCYLDKIATPQEVYRKELATGMAPMSFPEFLRRLDDGHLLANAHWAPQTALLPSAPLDYVGRVETLQADLRFLAGRLFGIEDMAMVTKEAGRSNSAALLAQYCGPGERRLIERLYARDYDAFYPAQRATA